MKRDHNRKNTRKNSKKSKRKSMQRGGNQLTAKDFEILDNARFIAEDEKHMATKVANERIKYFYQHRSKAKEFLSDYEEEGMLLGIDNTEGDDGIEVLLNDSYWNQDRKKAVAPESVLNRLRAYQDYRDKFIKLEEERIVDELKFLAKI